jgi:DNA ligase (NAD+)
MTEILGVPFKGQKVQIYKANMIIPQILRGERPNSPDIELICIPGTCPICGEVAEVIEGLDTTMLYCSNPQCEGKLINRLDHFCGKKGLDIKGLSKATLEKLINWGWILEIADIFTLDTHAKEWKQKPGFGEKSVEKILSAIEDARTTTLEKIISSIGIPLIGKTIAKDLVKRFPTYFDFRKAINESFDFSRIDGYGPEMTKSLLTFDYSELDNLVMKWLCIKETEENQNENSKIDLNGMVFVITGKLHHYKNRDALKTEIESYGGKVSGSVTKKTNYLINNDINSTSAKNKTAQSLGIPIITEEGFIKFLKTI